MTANQNAKDVLKYLCEGAETADKILEDHKVTFMESFQFVPTLMGAPAIIQKMPLAFAELKSADAEAEADIIKYAQDALNLSSEKTEGMIEDFIGLMTHGARLIGRLTNKVAA